MAELIVALDLDSADAAFRLLDKLPGVRWVKVGSVLMTREGAPLVHALLARGLHVFLDLKWHDIPNTVAGAVSAAGQLGVSLATVHTLGGRKMMEAAARAAAGQLRLVGVTVLTSHDDTSYSESIGRPGTVVRTEVVRLAGAARESGLDGVVCSPLEIAAVRATVGPAALVVVPGIRRPEDGAGDQQRTATPASAVRAGATHLVIGRPILEAVDPLEAFQSLAGTAG
ncbi:MAG: orotidine-5'-phosphate decarboxylase [Gemmatimonadota bacterium]